MAERDLIVEFLDKYLDIAKISDSSLNGVQVEGRKTVRKIALGVSASLELFEKAAACGADIVVVHHGLFWGKPLRLKGVTLKRISALIKNEMTLLAYHLPLDKHPVVGNNIQILRYFGAGQIKPFGEYNGSGIGFKGRLARPVSVEAICAVLNKRLGALPLCFSCGPARIKTFGVISGGAGDMVKQAIAEKLDAYITGEPAESAQALCREAGINFIAAGHYNSEKAGVLALGKLLQSRFKIPAVFIDIPNPC